MSEPTGVQIIKLKGSLIPLFTTAVAMITHTSACDRYTVKATYNLVFKKQVPVL